MIGRNRLGALLVLAVMIAAACTEGDGRATVQPIAAAGTVSAPARPIIVDPLPDGWSVESVEVWPVPTDPAVPNFLEYDPQTLYLPPGSTPESGPALAVGQYGEGSGSTVCGEWSNRARRSGDLVIVDLSPDADQEGYVLGRGTTEAEVEAASRSARFTDFTTSEIDPTGLPKGFRKVATARVIPNASNQGETIRLVNPADGQYAQLVAYDGDAAADLLTRFWNATVVKKTCRHTRARTARSVGATSVTIEGSSQKAVDRIAASLTATDQKGFDAFRKKTGDLPANALLTCLDYQPGPDVIFEGTQDEVRWLIGLAPVGESGLSCQELIINGERQGGSGSTLGPGFATAGTYGIEVLAGTSLIRDGELLTTIAGTVPSSATRVVISAGTVTTEAKLMSGGDPVKQYFGAFLRQAGSFPPSPTIVAYDAGGTEVGRHNPVPLG